MKAYCTILFLLFSVSVFAQNVSSESLFRGSVKGRIVDYSTGEALYRANLELVAMDDHQVIKRMSKDNGSFNITGLASKPYQLTISFTGYRSKVITVEVNQNKPIDLGTIAIQMQINELQEVVTLTSKIMMGNGVDKLVYHVVDDPDSRTASMYDILAKLPMISLDEDEDIQLNGSTNYQILVNGKKSPIFVHNLSEIFKSFPAMNIKDVEIISSPSAKYDSEGKTGIINIILFKETISGFNATAALGGDYPEKYQGSEYPSDGSSFLNFKTGNLGLTTYFNKNVSINAPNNNRSVRMDKILSNNLEQVGTSTNSNKNLSWGTELSLYTDSVNTISLGYGTNNGNGNSDNTQQINIYNTENELSTSYINLNHAFNTMNSYFMTANLDHNFNKQGDHNISFGYKVNLNNTINNSAFSTGTEIANNLSNSTQNAERALDETFQIDYARPFSTKSLEMGAKWMNHKNSSDYYYKRPDPVTGTIITETGNTGVFDFDQTVFSGYVSLRFNLGKSNVNLGARAEQTQTTVAFRNNSEPVIKSYYNLLPSLNWSYRINPTSIVRLSYSQRMDRPSLFYLNPYVDKTDPFNISYGNKDLKPSINNIFSMDLSLIGNKKSVTISLSHQFNQNSIQSYTTLGADSISRTTFGNIGKDYKTGLNLSGNISILKKVNMGLNGSAFYSEYSSRQGNATLMNKGFNYNLLSSLRVVLFKGWRVNGSMGYTSRGVSFQRYSGSNITSNSSLSKDFGKRKSVSFSFSCNNFHTGNRLNINEIIDPNFYQLYETTSTVRRYLFNLSFRMAKYK